MAEVKRGDIWLVNLDPTIGHEIKKSRPGVIIQNDLGNKYSQVTIVAPVTSQKTEKVYPFEVLLMNRISGLDKSSKVLLNQIRAIDKKRLVKRLGKVDEEILNRINEAIKISLGLVKA
ncbi:PemK family transcriptional regulator [Candidatus Woesearchaeota archaeon]|nr:PemK family transcriptional regulator [Candidatus Woesearchaeota archaeon]|tara:strand:- start:115 stop:468 length:354 start_codon:yes stop_codon:yes gene_type:complete